MNEAKVGVGITGDTSDLKQKVGSLGSELKSSMSGLTGMIAGAFGTGAIINFGRSMLNAAGDVIHTSEAMNIGTDSLQALKALAMESGVSFDDLSAALNRITRSQSDALTGNANLQKAFKALGISMSDLQGMSPDQIAQKIGVALKDSGRSAETTAASFDVMGRGTGRLLGMLETLGGSGMDALIEKYKKLGMVMDEVAIKQMHEAEIAMQRFGVQSKTVVAEILLGWQHLWATLGNMSKGMSWKDARQAAVDQMAADAGVGGKPKSGPGSEGDLAPTAEENKWYVAMEEKLLSRMKLTEKIAYYEHEISALQKSRAADPTDLTIATEILDREKKIRALKDQQAKSDEEGSVKLDSMYAAQDKLSLDYAKKRKDILNPETALMGPARVDSLQAIGGLIGGAGGQGDMSARIAERQAKTQEAIETLVRETNGKLEELRQTLDGIKQDIE